MEISTTLNSKKYYTLNLDEHDIDKYVIDIYRKRILFNASAMTLYQKYNLNNFKQAKDIHTFYDQADPPVVKYIRIQSPHSKAWKLFRFHKTIVSETDPAQTIAWVFHSMTPTPSGDEFEFVMGISHEDKTSIHFFYKLKNSLTPLYKEKPKGLLDASLTK